MMSLRSSSRLMPSIMARSKLKTGAGLLCWLILWEICARVIDLPFAIPTVQSTVTALARLVVTGSFWLTVASSLGRVLLGLLLGVACALVLAGLTVLSEWAAAFISPMMTVVRCTPVASFIMVLWILLGRDTVPQAIALLMVTPVIWKALCDGYAALDPAL